MVYNKIIKVNCNFFRRSHVTFTKSFSRKNSPSVSSCRKKSYNLWSDNSCDWSDWSEDFSFTFKSPVKRRNLSSDGDDNKFPPKRKSIKQLPKDDDREPLIKTDDDIDPDSTVFDPPKKKCSNYYFLFDKNFIKNS